jgi:flagellar biosynthesis/type III secretory pathway protein FliH
VLTDPMFRKVPELHLHFALRSETGVILTEDLQVHVLQLSNLRVTEENLRYASPLEQWSYFLLRAETLTMDEIKRLLPDEIFSEAASVLDVVAKTPEQKQRYEARLKFQRDEAARARLAREEGIEVGIEKGIEVGIERGELFGRIKTFQGLLGLVESTREELSDDSDEQLAILLEQLRDQLRSRNI